MGWGPRPGPHGSVSHPQEGPGAGGWGRSNGGQTGRSAAGRVREGSGLGNISLSPSKECPLGCVRPHPSCRGNYQARPAELCRGRAPWRPPPTGLTEGGRATQQHRHSLGKAPFLRLPSTSQTKRSSSYPGSGATEGRLGAPLSPTAPQGRGRHTPGPRRHHAFSRGPAAARGTPGPPQGAGTAPCHPHWSSVRGALSARPLAAWEPPGPGCPEAEPTSPRRILAPGAILKVRPAMSS